MEQPCALRYLVGDREGARRARGWLRGERGALTSACGGLRRDRGRLTSGSGCLRSGSRGLRSGCRWLRSGSRGLRSGCCWLSRVLGDLDSGYRTLRWDRGERRGGWTDGARKPGRGSNAATIDHLDRHRSVPRPFRPTSGRMGVSEWAAGLLAPNLAAQGLLVALAIAVACIARFGERRPLSSLGLRAPRASTWLWAAFLTLANVFVIAPAMGWLLGVLRSPGFGPSLDALHRFPAAYRAFIVLLGAPIEDFLYRGYAQERLEAITRSTVAGAVLCAVVSAFVHAPLWGGAVATVLLVPAFFAAAFYAWKRDLGALVIAHVITDFSGIVR